MQRTSDLIDSLLEHRERGSIAGSAPAVLTVALRDPPAMRMHRTKFVPITNAALHQLVHNIKYQLLFYAHPLPGVIGASVAWARGSPAGCFQTQQLWFSFSC